MVGGVGAYYRFVGGGIVELFGSYSSFMAFQIGIK
jgi:hypothetical protein